MFNDLSRIHLFDRGYSGRKRQNLIDSVPSAKSTSLVIRILALLAQWSKNISSLAAHQRGTSKRRKAIGQFMEINGRPIGPGYPTYIVAEMSANHNRSFDQATKIIETAKQVGADAVKLQTYTPETLTIRSENSHFRIESGTLWDGRTLYDLYEETYMPWDWQPRLKAFADNLGIELFSSAFDPSAVDFLERMAVGVHKVASFEILDIPLIEKMARTGKPLIMSTGMATIGEIQEAVTAATGVRSTQLALLKCNSAYPAPFEEMNLMTIPHLQKTFGLPVGLSDHTTSIAVPIAAVALGSCIVEKHITLSRTQKGPDSYFSLEPPEFKSMVDAIRTTERALGAVQYGVTEHERASLIFRRSLFVVEDIKAGEKFTSDNVRSIRPGTGLHPRHLHQIIGRPATQDIPRGTPLAWNMVGD
jgi:N-acetylneuraminate synthase